MQRTTFRTHGVERLDERTALAPYQLVELIDGGKSVPIGREEETNRVHHLFYSEKDDACLVAVWDEATHEIVTILPMHYRHRWVISLDAQAQARELILGSQPEQEAIRQPIDVDAERVKQYGFRVAEQDQAIVMRRLFFDNVDHTYMADLRFTFHFSAGPGMSIERSGEVFSARPSSRCQTIAALLADAEFQAQIREAIDACRQEHLPSYLAFASVRIGKKGSVIALHP